MKKIIALLLFVMTFAFSADVKPFYFNGVDSAQQQATWDELMKYKLWGTEYFSVGNGVIVPDESGRNGTTGELKGTGSETLLGGPIIVNGDINVGNGYTFPTGPVVANTMTMGNLNNGYFGGTMCLADTNVSDQIKQGLKKGGGELTTGCDSFPSPVGLSVPTVAWPDSELHALNVPMHGTGYIDVPAGEGPYDIYLSGITMDQESKLYVQIPDEGRLVRIFVNGKISLGNHAVIQTMSNGLPIPNDEYMGNLLFYTTEDLDFANTDYCIRQGTYISAGTFRMVSNVTFAGQMLGNKLVIGDNVDGKNFLFVSFDNPIINLGDPKTNALGDFVENNKNVEVPIYLDTLAPVKVTFNYCFILNDNATIEDFNDEAAPIPVCEKAEGKVTIAEGTSTPTEPVYVNVIDDGLVEGTEVVGLKIYNVSGASLPGNKRTHVFTLTLSDGDLFKINTDGIVKSVPENKKDTVLGTVTVLGKSDTTKIILADKDTTKYSLIEGVLTLKVPYDYETTQKDTITLIAIDGAKTDTTDVVIGITDVNENPIVEKQTFTLDENKKGYVGTITWKDTDSLNADFQINNCVLVSTTDTSFHVIDGKITTTKTHDFETEKDPVILVVKVQDKKDLTLFVVDTMKVTFNNVNEDIVATVKIDVIPEDTDIGTIVGAVIGKDGDSTTVSYTIDSKDFIINKNTGVITTNTKFDYETKKEYPVKVTITSEDGSKKDTTFTIKVSNVNEPAVVKDTTFSIPENKVDTLGKVSAKDEDNDKIYYSISDTANYAIDSNGVISVKVPFDYETKSKDTIKVYVTDGTFSDTATIVVDVKNVPEKPTVEDLIVVIEENDTGVIDTVKASDPDIGEKLTYTVNNPNLKVDSNGVLSVIKPFDYEQDSTIIAHVIVKDPTGLTDTATISIKVKDVNEPHTIKDETVKIPEDIKVPTPIDTVKVTDPDLHNDIKFELIDSTGTFKIDSNGVITIVKPVDYETKKEYEVKVIAKDSLYSDTATIKINITNVEENGKLDIQWVETRDTTITDTDKPIYTNSSSVNIDYRVDGITLPFDTTFSNLKEGENVIELCYNDPTKDRPGCDTVTIYYSTATPIITVATVNTGKGTINGQTIVDEPDGNQYVNKEKNDIQVTVKDPVDPRNDTTFVIKVDLHTIDVPAKVITNKVIEPIEDINVPTKHEVVGPNEIKVSYYDPMANANVSYITDSTGKRIDTNFTVEYVVNVGGKDVTISYTTDSYVEVKGNYTISYTEVNGTDTMLVSYEVNENGVVQKNKEGNVGYTVSYSYTNKYGNTGTSDVFVILDTVIPKVQILTPGDEMNYYTNSIEVVWTVDGIEQDTLNLERLEKGLNRIVRCYQDKAKNTSCDTVYVFMKNAKDIEIAIVNPVTEINQDKVDSFYADGGKYSKKEPFQVLVQDPKSDKLPEPIGVGLKVNIVLPSVSSTGGLATIDDMIQTVNGHKGILVNKQGELVSGTSTGADGSYTIPVETYIENHCNDEYKREYKKNGLEHTTIWDVKYKMHIWIFNTTAQYVNDFNFEYTLDDTNLANEAGILTMVVDWLAAKDGNIKSADGNAIATGAYIGKIFAVSISKTRCDLPQQPIGTKVKKDETEMFTFGYKRPISK